MFQCDASSVRGRVDTEAMPPLLGLTLPNTPLCRTESQGGGVEPNPAPN